MGGRVSSEAHGPEENQRGTPSLPGLRQALAPATRRLAVSLAVGLLRQETTNKRLHCVLDPNYLFKVLHTVKF